MALGTAISFEFQTVANQIIKAQHYHDVRTAINKVRGVAGLSDYVWTRPNLSGLTVNAADTTEMRSALDAALTALSIPVTAYTDSTLTVAVTLIKAPHLEELQTRSTRGQSTSSGPADSDSSSARLDPMNQTGGGGENPLSRNFNWNLPLVTLPGRAGLDLSLTLSYNSLVWTKIGSTAMWFDADNGFPGPGFRLGFPVIQQLYYNAEVGKNAFLFIGSDGRRTELRQVGTSALYESADSAHMLLESNSMVLSLTDGTQLTYELRGGEFKCAKIKDRNGNYISVNYNALGQITTITDTLGRVIQFNYDTCNNLVSIDVPGYGGTAQNPVTTTIARFDYTTATVSTSFSGLTVENVPSGYPVVELSHIYFPATQTGYKFTYSAYGMISTVSLRKDMTYNGSTGAIADGNEKAYVSFNYPASASSLTDAPSFSQWTQSPAATSGGTATWSFTSSSGSGTKSFTITNPDASTMTMTRSDTSGTSYGLLTQTEVKTSGGTSKAKSVISYTTDGGGQPQVANVVTYDDATPTANQTKVDFDYDSYGNVTNTRE